MVEFGVCLNNWVRVIDLGSLSELERVMFDQFYVWITKNACRSCRFLKLAFIRFRLHDCPSTPTTCHSLIPFSSTIASDDIYILIKF